MFGSPYPDSGNPRETSMSWSMKADSGGNADSPSRHSANEFSNRASSNAVNVSRGDSLAYSDDSQDQRNLLRGQSAVSKQGASTKEYVPSTTNVGAPVASADRNSGPVLKKPICKTKTPTAGGNDSMSEDSLQEEQSKRACCTIQ